MKKILFLTTLFLVIVVEAKFVVFKGVYTGSNVYVHNVYEETLKIYCVTYVYVNGVKMVDHPSTSAFEIPMDSLEIGEKIEIKIYAHQECMDQVKLLNPQVIRQDARFSFSLLKADKTVLTWRSKGESPQGRYEILYNLNQDWVKIDEFEGKHEPSEDYYSIPIRVLPGDNKFKIIFVEGDGTRIESDEVIYNFQHQAVRFYPIKVSDNINFSPSIIVNYKILNLKGELIKKGKAKAIDCSDIPVKQYYIIYFNNQKGTFYKKK